MRAARRRTTVAAFSAVASAALVLGMVGGAAADDERAKKQRVDSAISALHGDLHETSQELVVAGLRLQVAGQRLQVAQARVAQVRGRLAAARARDRALGAALKRAVAEVQRAERELSRTQGAMEVQRTTIGRIARSSYQQGALGEMSVMLESQTPDQFASRIVLVQTAMRSEDQVLQRLADVRADTAAARSTLDAKRAQVAAMKAEQEQVVEGIAGLERDAVDARGAVARLVTEQAAALRAVEQQKAAEERRLAVMQAESQRLQGILVARAKAAKAAAARAAAARFAAARARARSTGGGNGGGGGASRDNGPVYVPRGGALAYPAYGPITSPYGMRVHPVTGIYKLHDGTDFGVGCGTPVHAAADGVVVQAYEVGGYGNQLVIDHGVLRGSGVATSYNHLSRFVVYSGRVSRGQLIGYSGGGPGMQGAGYSTGCHLHFMVYVDGVPVDPMGWL